MVQNWWSGDGHRWRRHGFAHGRRSVDHCDHLVTSSWLLTNPYTNHSVCRQDILFFFNHFLFNFFLFTWINVGSSSIKVYPTQWGLTWFGLRTSLNLILIFKSYLKRSPFGTASLTWTLSISVVLHGSPCPRRIPWAANPQSYDGGHAIYSCCSSQEHHEE